MKRYILALLAIVPIGLLLGIAIGRETAPREMRPGPEPLGSRNEPGGWAQPASPSAGQGGSTRADIFPDRRDLASDSDEEDEYDAPGAYRPDLDYDEEVWDEEVWGPDFDAPEPTGDKIFGDPDSNAATPPRTTPRQNPARKRDAAEAAGPAPDDGLPPIW